MNPKSCLFLACLWGFSLAPAAALAQVDVWGKIEEEPIYSRHDTKSRLYEAARPLGLIPPKMGNVLNIRGYAEARSGDNASARVQLSLISEIEEKKTEQTLRLDRAYMDWNFRDVLSVRAGKQIINWGTGYAWNPTTDDINVTKDILDPTNEVEGVSALRTDLLLGPFTVSAVGVPKPEPDQCQAIGKVKVSTEYGDYSLSAIRDRDPRYKGKAFGGDFVLNIEGMGLHAEGLYREGSAIQHRHRGSFFRYLGGVDYTPPWGTYLFAEYFHTDEGFDTFDDYFDALAQEYLLKRGTWVQDMLTRGVGVSTDYVFVMGRHYFDEFDTVTANLIVNLRDGSYVAQPKWEHSLAQALNLYVWADLISPGVDGEFADYPLDWRAVAKVIFSF